MVLPAGRRARPPRSGEAGQAGAELVALLPLIVLVAALLWQVVLAGHATWAAGAAARAASRAHALGHDPLEAARLRLPDDLRRGLEVRPHRDGVVRVAVRIPAVASWLELGHAAASVRFSPQTPEAADGVVQD